MWFLWFSWPWWNVVILVWLFRKSDKLCQSSQTRLKHTYEMLCGWLMLLNCLQTPKHVCWRKNPWRLPMSGGSWVSEAKTHLSYGPTYVYTCLYMLIPCFLMLSWCLSHLSDFHIQHQPSQAILTIHLYPGIIHYNSIELNHLHTHIYVYIYIYIDCTIPSCCYYISPGRTSLEGSLRPGD